MKRKDSLAVLDKIIRDNDFTTENTSAVPPALLKKSLEELIERQKKVLQQLGGANIIVISSDIEKDGKYSIRNYRLTHDLYAL